MMKTELLFFFNQFIADYNDEDKKDNRKKKGPQCYKCKGWGHKKGECPELKKGGGTASVMIAKKQDDSDSDGDILTVSSEKCCEAWLLDSASSFHATPKKGVVLVIH